ncbi:MAG: hypothetical protein NT062_27585 [Proteobacteria bacterium]|nr:hypothetical protein [Pseudomonadota bacterium]
MRILACALLLVACARDDRDPPPRVTSGAATLASATLPPWFGRPHAPPHQVSGTLEGGGMVHLRMAAPDPTGWAGLDVAVRADGAFDLGPQRAGRYVLLATAPGRTSRVVEIDALDGDIVAELHAYPCTSVTRVVRAHRRPLEGATIDVGGVAIATTDRAGRFTACVNREPLVATVRARGFGATSVTFSLADTARDVELQPARDLAGDVTGVDGKRAAGLAVHAVGVPVLAMTDDAGRFTLRGVADGRYQFRILDGARDVVDRTTVHEAGSDEVAHVMLAYARADEAPLTTARLVGFVVHAGRPLADAEVRIGPHATRTRGDGSYALGYVAAPGAILRVAHPSGLATARALAMGASSLTIELADTGTIAGTVVDTHGDPARCRVRISARDTANEQVVTPGPGGHFSFVAELGETYELVAVDDERGDLIDPPAAGLEVTLDASLPNITGLEIVVR